jgi:hypothetical protein
MVTNLCFGLTCLLIPLLIELFYLQASLQLTDAGHTLVEVLIVCGIYWLFIQILRLDERLYLWNFAKLKPRSDATSRKIGRETSIEPISPLEHTKTEHLQEPAYLGRRMSFGTQIKNRRTIKPL